MKRLVPFFAAVGGLLGSVLAYGAFGRLSLAVALAAAAGAILGAAAMLGISLIRSRRSI